MSIESRAMSVIVGYDDSRAGEQTLAEAAWSAHVWNAPLVVLNAYPAPTPHGATLPLPATNEWAPTDLVDSANLLVGHAITLVRSWYPRLAVQGRVVAGRASEVLQEASREAALLVLGVHGGAADTLPGSVTPRVLADAACPVLVVPADPHRPSGHPTGHPSGHPTRRPVGRHPEGGPVVAAVDIDGPCDDVLDFAFAEAGRRAVALEVVHVWEQPWNVNHLRHTTGLGHDIEEIEEQRRLRLAELVHTAGGRYPGIEPLGRVESGSTAKTLVRTSQSAGLVVVGARRQGPGGHHRLRIGPVVHALLHRAECPVAVVPNGPAPNEPRDRLTESTRRDATGPSFSSRR